MTTHHPYTTTTTQDRGIPLAPLAVFILLIMTVLAVRQVTLQDNPTSAGAGSTVETAERAELTRSLEAARATAKASAILGLPQGDDFSPEKARAVGNGNQAVTTNAIEQRKAFDSQTAPAATAESNIVQRYDVGNGHPDIRTATAQRNTGNGHPDIRPATVTPAEPQGELRYDPNVGHPVMVNPTASANVLDYPFGEGLPGVQTQSERAPAWDGGQPTEVPG